MFKLIFLTIFIFLIHIYYAIYLIFLIKLLILQFRPAASVQQHMQYMPVQTQHFQSIGQGTHITNVVPPEQLQYSQQMNPRTDQPPPGPPSSQGVPMPYMQQSRPTFASVHPQQNSHPLSNHLPTFSGVGPPISSSYSVSSNNIIMISIHISYINHLVYTLFSSLC